MDKNVKNALRDLLLFKVGIKPEFINDGILTPIEEEFLFDRRVINAISQDDLDSGYVGKGSTGKIFTRKPLEIDNRLLYKDFVINYLTNAVDNFVKFIEDLRDGRKSPLVDTVIGEALSADDLIKIIYKMPILHGIHHSEDKNFVYLKEISVEEIIKNSKKYEYIYVEFNNDRIEKCNIDWVLERIRNGNIDELKFYIPEIMVSLGYADSTFTDNLKWKCNRIYLCQKTIVSEIIRMALNDPWNNNKFWISVLYHELSHVIFGHGRNIPVPGSISTGVYKINVKKEHEAQTYSSVLFSDVVASEHIRSYSNNQPVEYQNMPLWGIPDIASPANSINNIIPAQPVIIQNPQAHRNVVNQFDENDFRNYLLHQVNMRGKPYDLKTVKTYVGVIKKLLNSGVLYMDLVNNIDKHIENYKKRNCDARGENDHDSHSALNKFKKYLKDTKQI